MPTNAQREIAEHLRRVAEWRRAKMQEFDPDPRNLRSAAGLDELADYVLSLPEDDERIQELQRLAFEGDFFTPGQMTTWEIPRFRFHHEHTSVDAFLNKLVELAEKDASEEERFGGLMPEGDNPWSRTQTRIFVVEVEHDPTPDDA